MHWAIHAAIFAKSAYMSIDIVDISSVTSASSLDGEFAGDFRILTITNDDDCVCVRYLLYWIITLYYSTAWKS